jgi:hypothetical protein
MGRGRYQKPTQRVDKNGPARKHPNHRTRESRGERVFGALQRVFASSGPVRRRVVGGVAAITSLMLVGLATDRLSIASPNLRLVSFEMPQALSVPAVSPDSLVVPMEISIRLRNWSFRQGWLDRCEVQPRGLRMMPTVSQITVDKTPIRSFSSRTVSCSFRASVPVGTYPRPPQYRVALYDQEGKQIDAVNIDFHDEWGRIPD